MAHIGRRGQVGSTRTPRLTRPSCIWFTVGILYSSHRAPTAAATVDDAEPAVSAVLPVGFQPMKASPTAKDPTFDPVHATLLSAHPVEPLRLPVCASVVDKQQGTCQTCRCLVS